MPEIYVIAKLVAQKGHEETVRNELNKLIEPTRKEDGCLEYNLHQDNANPGNFVFLERWKSSAAIDMHMQSEHIAQTQAAIGNLLEGMSMEQLSRLS
jgi:quinol monooxygenase YgiN